MHALVYQRVFFLADLVFQTCALGNLRKFAFDSRRPRALLESLANDWDVGRSPVTLVFDIQIYANAC
jgi:hypothetical protein